MKDQFIINDYLEGIENQVSAIRGIINKPEPIRPEPKFAKGDMTDKGKIVKITWNIPTSEGRYYEDELTAVPSIKITLFKVKDGKVETESLTTTMPINKDVEAKYYFEHSYCAILIEQDGIAEWKPCPELKAVYKVNKEWYNMTATISDITSITNEAINHPKWTVESSGVKMRAYMSKTGESVKVEYQGLSASMTFNNHDPLLTALGFNSDNIQKNILHGKG